MRLSALLALTLAVACSSSDDVQDLPRADAAVALDAAADAGAGSDAGFPEDAGGGLDQGADAGADASAPDGALDLGTADVGPTTDGGLDAGADAGADGGLDAGVDAGADGGAGDAGAGPACNPTFGMANACGGTPIGTWTYRAACSDRNPSGPGLMGCPGAMISNVARSASGTLSLTAAGTFTRSVTTVTTGQLFLPTVCVMIAGQTCATLGAAIPTFAPNATGTCASATGGCTCQLTLTDQLNDSGTVSVSGGTVTTTSPSGTGTYWFCAQPGQLEYRGQPTNPTDPDVTYVLTP